MEQVVVLENLFYERNIFKIFDLKGTSKNRYVDIIGEPLQSFEKGIHERRLYKRDSKTKEVSKTEVAVNEKEEKNATVESEPPYQSSSSSSSSSGVTTSIVTQGPVLPTPTREDCFPRIEYPIEMRRKCSQTLLDDNFVELTRGRPFPLKHRAKVRNTTLWYPNDITVQ